MHSFKETHFLYYPGQKKKSLLSAHGEDILCIFQRCLLKKRLLKKIVQGKNLSVTFNRNMRDLLRIVPQYRLGSVVLTTYVHIISSPGGKYLVCLSVSTKFSYQTKSCIFLIIFLVSPGTEALISCSMFCP